MEQKYSRTRATTIQNNTTAYTKHTPRGATKIGALLFSTFNKKSLAKPYRSMSFSAKIIIT